MYVEKTDKRQSAGMALGAMKIMAGALAPVLLLACTATSPPDMSVGHIRSEARQEIPQPVLQSPLQAPPADLLQEELYTVVVTDVEVKELLFALARDAGRNIDVHQAIKGKVTINAVNQPLFKILDRIAQQVPIRYRVHDGSLVIRADTPYLESYRVDYVNMTRESRSTVSVATEIATTGGSIASQNGNSGSGDVAGNRSKTQVTNTSEAKFWESLVANIKAIVVDREVGAKANVAGDDVIANPMSGIITVRATGQQHQMIQSLIERVQHSAHRQVLIEASIVEVELGDRYQSGVDWQRLAQGSDFSGAGSNFGSQMIGGALQTSPFLFLGYNKTNSNGSNISAAIRMLETFGDVKVLSSPKIMALNNQTALLKVVDEKVYFTVDRDEARNADGVITGVNYTSEIHTVPVGLVMSVTPQITELGVVTMNVRPTISRITGYAVDPAPRLAIGGADFDNLIPEIQVREMESLLKVDNGSTVVLGGLMQNKVSKSTSGVPFLASLPLIGHLFSFRDEEFKKTELVIFLRPTVIDSANQSKVMDVSQYMSTFASPK